MISKGPNISQFTLLFLIFTILLDLIKKVKIWNGQNRDKHYKYDTIEGSFNRSQN